jgi:hypothetical protein
MADPSLADSTAEHLSALLRRTVAEPSPEAVREAARAALSWRDPDAALATLVADSADPTRQLESAVRGGGQSRLLAFATADVSIDVEVNEDPTVATLVGQLAPVGAADIAVDHRDGVAEATADELGRFRVEGVTRGPVRLRCTPRGAGTPVHTEWTLL